VRAFFVALCVLPFAAGCGTEAGSRDASDAAPAEASSSRVEMSIEGGAPSMSYLLQGAMDYARHRGEFSLSGAKGDPGPKTHLILIGRDSYLGVEVGGTMRWQKQSAEASSGTERFLPGPDSASPDRVLPLLKKFSSDVQMVGDEQIGGVPTRHFQAHLDMKRLAPGDLDAPGDLVVDAWIDGDGLARRLRVPFGGKDAPVAAVDQSDFGVDVDAQAPPADAIVSEKEFERLVRQECKREDRVVESPICWIFTAELMTSSGSGTMGVTEDK